MRKAGTRTIKAPEVRRADLLAAAARVLLERGVEGATVEDITTAAGVAKGTFYLYFSSKDELLDALRQQFQAALAEHLASIVIPPPGGDWGAFTSSIVRASVDVALAHRDLHRLVARGPQRHEDALGQARDATRVILERVIRAGIEAGVYRVADPEAAATLLFELIHTACDRACELPGEADRIAAAASDIVRRALLVADER